LHAHHGELPRRPDPASAVLPVRHELREDDADLEGRAPAAAGRAVQRAEPGDLRRTAVREQRDECALRLDRPQRGAAVELPAVRSAGVEAAVLRRAALALLLVASLGLAGSAGERTRRVGYGDLAPAVQRALAG